MAEPEGAAGEGGAAQFRQSPAEPKGLDRRVTRLPVYVSALVICQDAFRDDRGRTHLHGVFDNLNANGFPVSAQFTVWCSVKGRGTARVVIKINDTLDTTLALTEPLIAEVTPFKGHEFFYAFSLNLAGGGLYKITAFVDGIPAMEVPLMVRHAAPAPQAAPPPPPPAG
jgi:hypothetical protein